MANKINFSWMTGVMSKGNEDGQGWAYTADIYPDIKTQKWVTISPLECDIIGSTANPVFTRMRYRVSVRYRVQDFSDSVTARQSMSDYFETYLSAHLGNYVCESLRFIYEQYSGDTLGFDLIIES